MDPYGYGGDAPSDDRQLFIGRSFGPWFAGGWTPAGNVLGPVFMVLLAPFLAARWFFERYGWGGVAALGVATAFVVWFVTRTLLGRLVALALLYFVAMLVCTYFVGSLLLAGWAAAGAVLH